MSLTRFASISSLIGERLLLPLSLLIGQFSPKTQSIAPVESRLIERAIV